MGKAKINPKILEDFKKVTQRDFKTPSQLIDEDILAVKNYAAHAEQTKKAARALVDEINGFIKAHKENPYDGRQFEIIKAGLTDKVRNLRLPKNKARYEDYRFQILRQSVTPHKRTALCTLFPGLDAKNVEQLLSGCTVTLCEAHIFTEPGRVVLGWYDNIPSDFAYIRKEGVYGKEFRVSINKNLIRAYLSRGCTIARLGIFLLDNKINCNFTDRRAKCWYGHKEQSYTDFIIHKASGAIIDYYPESAWNISRKIKYKKIKKYLEAMSGKDILEQKFYEYLSAVDFCSSVNAEKESELFEYAKRLDSLISCLNNL